jgi:tRNA1Val (adenine37-N6)-methyltransferase
VANNYFRFKKFNVQQDNCAMKVCTDSCLFGAVTAGTGLPVTNCLDIGTGTGLLALMFAQQNKDVIIDAVELDAPAAEQARENAAASPWANRIHVFNEDIMQFDNGKQYDCILSNPPFFEDDLQSPVQAKNNAKHDASLTFNRLLPVVDKLLANGGHFAVLLPFHRVDHFIGQAEKSGLYPYRQVSVKQTPGHPYFRGILFFRRDKTDLQIHELTIKDESNQYSVEFAAFLKDYYLYM